MSIRAAPDSFVNLGETFRRLDVEPGTKWAYSNHGFTTLGQVVEDVSGIRLDRYLRERLFDSSVWRFSRKRGRSG